MKTAANYPAHLNAENMIRAFNKNIGEKELAARVALMVDANCTPEKVADLNKKWKK